MPISFFQDLEFLLFFLEIRSLEYILLFITFLEIMYIAPIFERYSGTFTSVITSISFNLLYNIARNRYASNEKNMCALIFSGVKWYIGDAMSRTFIVLKHCSILTSSHKVL